MRVVSFGSVNVDRVFEGTADEVDELAARFDPTPETGETVHVSSVPDLPSPDRTNVGGKGANQAAAAARAGAETAMLGAVGDDESGAHARDVLADRGVETARLASVDAPTGRAFVMVDQTGENRIAVLEGANGRVDPTYATRVTDAIREADALLLQNEVPVPAMDTLLDNLDTVPDAPTVVLDPAPPEGAGGLLYHDSVDYITPNEHEYEALADARQTFDGTVVQTRGADDVLVEGDVEFRETPPPVDVVDTTGAGDAFAGYFAARLAAGDDVRAAVERATAASSLTTTREGTQTAVPTPDEVAELVGETG